MKHTIKNLINSPYDVVTVDGLKRIEARGELTDEFDERALMMIRQIGYFQISEADALVSDVKVNTLSESVNKSAETEHVTEPIKRGPGRPKKAD